MKHLNIAATAFALSSYNAWRSARPRRKLQIRCAPHALENDPMTQRNALPIAGRLRAARSAVAARGR